MAYFQVGGTFAVPVRRDTAKMTTPDVGGVTMRTFAGSLRSTRRWVKRQWDFTTTPMTFADIASLVAIIGSPQGGAFVSCNGTFNNNVAVTCAVTITGREDAKVSNTEIRQRLSLLVQEV